MNQMINISDTYLHNLQRISKLINFWNIPEKNTYFAVRFKKIETDMFPNSFGIVLISFLYVKFFVL